mgnify:CR=1 FL=1
MITCLHLINHLLTLSDTDDHYGYTYRSCDALLLILFLQFVIILKLMCYTVWQKLNQIRSLDNHDCGANFIHRAFGKCN